jgi:hypothetical protein
MIDKSGGLLKYAKYSLVFLWVFTGVSSLLFAPELGYELLAEVGIKGYRADLAVYGGSLADIFIGLWLLTSKYIRLCCIVQIVFIMVYTILLTIVDASYWIHPFGPLTKNIPIIVLIGVLLSAGENKRKVF